MDEDISKIEEECEDKEPQLTSEDPNERKLARKLRIERRLEAIRKLNMPEGEEEEIIIEKTLLQKQLQKSTELLEKLEIQSNELITNVRVANDAREVDRREEEGIGREKVIQALDEEAATAVDKFNEISEKWVSVLKYNDPLQISDEILAQKEKSDELIQQKNEIISMLRNEIRTAELKFAKDQRKQNNDIEMLAKRIEKQVSLMRGAYRAELQLIEEVIMTERKMLIEANEKRWEEVYKRRDQEEEINADKKTQQLEEFDEICTNLRIEHQEKFRATKIKLENNVEGLQQEFENMKAVVLINTEKLDYNYQILKKREDENIIIRSQQKRKMNKLQDIMNILRNKIRTYEEESENQISGLTREVKKLQKSVLDVEAKADHFAKLNDDTYKQIWDFNYKKAKGLLDRILATDSILYEQQLGLPWLRPDHQLLDKRDLPSYVNAIESLREGALKVDYQILKKREDENIIIRSQQKRKMNKLQDIMNILRNKIRTYEEESENHISGLAMEVKKLQKSVLDVEAKADHFAKLNDDTYKQIWDFNYKKAKDLLDRILATDSILYEQQLALPWLRPDHQLLDKRDLPSYVNAIESLREVALKDSKHPSSKSAYMKDATVSLASVGETMAHRRLLRQILNLIANKCGFLIEARLTDILEPFMYNERSLIKVDCVFMAMGIKRKEEIEILLEYFLPYTHCPICTVGLPSGDEDTATTATTPETASTISPQDAGPVPEPETQQEAEKDESLEEEESLYPSEEANILNAVHQPLEVVEQLVMGLVQNSAVERPSITSSFFNTSLLGPKTIEETNSESESVSNSYAKPGPTSDTQSTVSAKLSCFKKHPLVISPVYTYKALKSFVNKFFVAKEGAITLTSRLLHQRKTVSRLVDSDEVQMFWERFRTIFSPTKEELWNGLMFGLQKYHEILKDRRKLHEELLSVRKQNQELNLLLMAYKGDIERKLKPPCAIQREIPILPKEM